MGPLRNSCFEPRLFLPQLGDAPRPNQPRGERGECKYQEPGPPGLPPGRQHLKGEAGWTCAPNSFRAAGRYLECVATRRQAGVVDFSLARFDPAPVESL